MKAYNHKKASGFGAVCSEWSNDRRTLVKQEIFDGKEWLLVDKFLLKYGGKMNEGCYCKTK